MHRKIEDLPDIPLVELGGAGLDRLAELYPERMLTAQAAARRHSTAPVLDVLEALSRRWLKRNRSPYVQEIETIARLPGTRYAHALNLSTEWACTTLAVGARLYRTLDWPLRRIAPSLVVTRHASPLGVWLQATWPGYVGVLNGLAPRRFAAAFNMPPLRRRLGLFSLDWALERRRIGRSQALPPEHLLRRAFEEAPDFAAALIMLRDTEIAMPALFSLAGADGKSVVIERQERSARLHDGPTAIANQWHALSPTGELGWPKAHPRGIDSPGRQRAAFNLLGQSLAAAGAAAEDFAWLQRPILNKYTRLAAIMDAGSGELSLFGLEQSDDSALPATRFLRLNSFQSKSLEPAESG